MGHISVTDKNCNSKCAKRKKTRTKHFHMHLFLKERPEM